MPQIVEFESLGDNIFGLSQYLTELIDRELTAKLESEEAVPLLKEAVYYANFPGGKRIRPLIALLLCHDFKGDPLKLAPVVSSLELIHSASLVHDDLPALDNDDLRRGKPSCHKAFPESTAILTGDILCAMSVNSVLESDFSDSDKLKMLKKLTTSFQEICNGQQLDLLEDESRGDVLEIYKLKTGSLFSCACYMAGVSVGGSEELLNELEMLGYEIGKFFQIVDDLIDSSELKGRGAGQNAGSDERNKRQTLVTEAEVSKEQLCEKSQNTIADLMNNIKRLQPHLTLRGLRYVLDIISRPLEALE